MRLFVFLILTFTTSLTACFPSRRFEKKKHPPVTDYSNQENWIALYPRHDIGDTIPPTGGLKDEQDSAKADVFYIHPTVYIFGHQWNAFLNYKKINERADRCVQFQGTAYNSACRVYAPRYRQANLKAFFDTVNGNKALDLAYEDIRNAFRYYLEHYNNGRPIVIAGHSQGARHAARLVKEFFDGTPLQKKLVCAYPIGYNIRSEQFKSIPPGDSATQTGCFVTWNTFAWGSELRSREKKYWEGACVNPLTWKRDETYAPASLNKGGVSFYYYRVDPCVCDAQVHKGILWVHHPVTGWYPGLGKSYHIIDYNLFYVDIRENVRARVNAYLKKTE